LKSRLAPNAGNLAGPLIPRELRAKAKRALLTDVEGRECIDFAGGIGVKNVGHQHPKVLAAIRDQLETYMHPCFHIM
jgi:4-aminobutyrate aminotransferase-like enzyme